MEAHDEKDGEEEEKIVTTQNLFHIQYSTSLEQRICVVYAAERIWNYVDWKLKFQLCYILLIPSHSGCCQAPYIIRMRMNPKSDAARRHTQTVNFYKPFVSSQQR